jgi:ATP-dependent DNA helicase PIF1
MKILNYSVSFFRRYSAAAKPKTARKTSAFKPKKPPRKTPDFKWTSEIKWTNQQLEVLAAVADRKSIFITGSGGTGKTLLLQHIIKGLKQKYTPSRVFATASTGVAACHINGQTLHSFAGIGSGQGDRDSLLNKVLGDEKAVDRWKCTSALIIDECSMINASVLIILSLLLGRLDVMIFVGVEFS